MKLKTSFFNKYLYLKTLLRFWPLWVLVSIGGCVLSAVSVLGEIDMSKRDAEFTKYIFYNDAANIFPWVTLFYAIVVAMCVWGYLYHRSSNYHFHSMPVSRTSLFVSNFIAGYTICLIPFVFAAAMQVFILVTTSTFHFASFLFAVATALVESLFFFSMATLVAFITSNSVALPILYFVFNVLSIVIENETWSLVSNFYPGYGDNPDALNFLSPIAWINENIDFVYERNYNFNSLGYTYVRCEINGGSGLWILLAGAVILTACAYVLYRSKRNEDVGMAVSVRWLRPVLLVVFSYTAAVVGSIFIWYLANNFYTYTYYSVGTMAALAVLCGGIAFMVGLMILKRTTRIFTGKNVISFAVFAVAIVFMYASIGNDWFCLARSIPAKSDVDTVTVWLDGYSYEIGSDNMSLLTKAMDANTELARESEYIKSFDFRDLAVDESFTSEYVSFRYKLKNGKTVAKNYKPVFTKERVYQAGTYENKLYELSGDKFFTLERTRLNRMDKIIEVYLTDYTTYDSVTLTGNELKAFLEAVYDDVVDNGALRPNWFGDIEQYGFSVDMRIAGDDTDPVNYYGYAQEDWYYFILEETMTNTVNYLKEHNMISKEALSGEMKPGRVDYVK